MSETLPYNPALPVGCILFLSIKKGSTIVDNHENKPAFCLINDHQHHEDNFDSFCYSHKESDDERQIFDLLRWF